MFLLARCFCCLRHKLSTFYCPCIYYAFFLWKQMIHLHLSLLSNIAFTFPLPNLCLTLHFFNLRLNSSNFKLNSSFQCLIEYKHEFWRSYGVGWTGGIKFLFDKSLGIFKTLRKTISWPFLAQIVFFNPYPPPGPPPPNIFDPAISNVNSVFQSMEYWCRTGNWKTIWYCS